jgi:hypothetical protein
MSRLPSTASLITACAAALLLAACSADRPTAASSRPDGEAAALSHSRSADSDHDDDDDRGWLQLVSINGPGVGRIRATRMDDPETGHFVAHIEIEVRRAPPNTTYLIQRAPEVNPADADGSCTRGLGMGTQPATWSPSFVTFPGQTLTTDRRGRGELEFRFAPGRAFPAFDVMFRLVQPGDAAQSVFLSECTTLRP